MNIKTDSQALPTTIPKPRTTHADDAYALLKKDIAEFRLVPGDRFTEGKISQRLGVSRTPIRQALFRLQQEGFVEVMFRSGWRVLPFDFKKFEQFYDLRKVLESEATRRLCTEAADTNRSCLEPLIKTWCVDPRQRIQDMEKMMRLDENFHCALVEATGNDEMVRIHRDITDHIRIIRRLDFTKTRRIDATYEEHAEILMAIKTCQTDTALRLLNAHIRESQTEVQKITLQQIYLAHQASLV